MMKIWMLIGMSASVALLATPVLAYDGQTLEKGAKLKIAAARDIALRAHPGAIKGEELEKESGGSGLRYSFVIKSASGDHEVGIDAITGAVLENAKEGAHPD